MWYAAIVAWIILCIVGYHIYNKKSLKPTLLGIAEFLCALTAIAVVLGIIFLVFIWIPELLFGNIGVGAGLFTMFSGLFYLCAVDDFNGYKEHPRLAAFKYLVFAWAVVIPIGIMLYLAR